MAKLRQSSRIKPLVLVCLRVVRKRSTHHISRHVGTLNLRFYSQCFCVSRKFPFLDSVEAERRPHAELLRHRHEWFEKFVGFYVALWWVPVGHKPGIDEAKKRLAHLERYGATEFAFTFKNVFEPDEKFQQRIDWSSFEPCPAM